MTRLFVSAFLFAVLFFGIAASPAAAQSDLDCKNFSSQEDAQATFNADRSDPNRLDGDNDGYACETFFGYIGAPAADVPDADPGAPVGTDDGAIADDVSALPATGTGPLTGSSSSGILSLLAAGALLFAAAGARVRSTVQR